MLPQTQTKKSREATAASEWVKCQQSVHYFIHTYIKIYDATRAQWIPFKLWPLQGTALQDLVTHRLNLLLKARQLGMSWMCLAYGLHKMLFHPSATFLIFSRREDEATYLLDRLRGMYDRLPSWQKVRRVHKSNTQMWKLSNGSVAYGFPTTAGDSYTASIAMVDEADLVPNLDQLMNAVKPTIDGGGSMMLISRANKDTPQSPFKKMFRAAMKGNSPWNAIFLPWFARPERDAAWYESQKQDVMARTGSLDDLYQQYPATVDEALQSRTLDKRIPPQWVLQCFDADAESQEADNSVVVYEEPEWMQTYVIGADPAEGNPTSDDSSLTVMGVETGREVASYAGKMQPIPFAELLAHLAATYNDAGVLVERNNHGHLVIAHLAENTGTNVLLGWDGKLGWHTTTRGKASLLTTAAEALRDYKVTIRSELAKEQLLSIEGRTLKAPPGMHDDAAVSFCLATRAKVGDGNRNFSMRYQT